MSNKLQESYPPVNPEFGAKAALAVYFDCVLRNIAEAVLLIALDGTVAILNDAAAKFLNIKRETALAKRYWEVFPDDHFGFPMREALRFGISHKLLYKSFLAEKKEAEVSTSFVFEGPKPFHGMVILLKDITEKQKLQRIVSRNDRMRELGEAAAAIAHEIRNPLGGIRGYASLLYRDLQNCRHLQEYAGAIIEGTKALEKAVIAVLQYAKPVDVQPQTVEIGSYLKQIGKFVKADPAFPDNVKWVMHIPDAPLLAPIDKDALKSALLNLIFNAFQAMPEGGTLTLSLLKMDASYQIAIADTGVGMDEEQLKSLFSPFFTTKQTGNGLGLVETKKIAQAHGGSIDVRSQPGRGSTFTLTLPLRNARLT